MTARRTPLESLLRRLEIEALDRDLFLGEPGRGEGRLFGGMVAAQSFVAAAKTVDGGGEPHSLHAYFLRPGSHSVPIRFVVHRIRDGRTFTTRHVVAHQAGEAIFDMSVSFSRPEEGIAHQDEMPEAPAPDSLENYEDLRARILGDPSQRRPDGPIEIRAVDPDEPDKVQPPTKKVWIRPAGELPADPLVHAAMLIYASDRTLLSTAGRPHALTWGRRISASLDHAMWLHEPTRFDDWILYATESPVARSGRGLNFGAMYRQDGVRIASVAQEGIIRIPRRP
ncbi:hypothetical protein AYO38_08530 [bacterium SCGC AG-212-C10]|nr:hypothetical protein AYO38_08530 [bacterium SCGC AG-212-C10]